MNTFTSTDNLDFFLTFLQNLKFSDYQLSISLLVRVNSALIASTIKILISPVTFQVNSDITIVFPAPELVCSNIYMVGVPCFFTEL